MLLDLVLSDRFLNVLLHFCDGGAFEAEEEGGCLVVGQEDTGLLGFADLADEREFDGSVSFEADEFELQHDS